MNKYLHADMTPIMVVKTIVINAIPVIVAVVAILVDRPAAFLAAVGYGGSLS